jgi:hypothetical protein
MGSKKGNMKRNLVIIIVLGLALAGCEGEKSEAITNAVASLIREKINEKVYEALDKYADIPAEEESRRRKMYAAIAWRDVEEIREFLEQGYDPDQCLGSEGWNSSNPLVVIMRRVYFTLVDYENNRPIPEPTPDVAMMRALVEGGADIHRFPYIWRGVYGYSNDSIEQIQTKVGVYHNGELVATQEEADQEKARYVQDVNRLIEAYLEAGAGPDKPGHPYPFRPAKKDFFMTNEEANAYFSKGTRAINEAIKKGVVWESQVDLLLRYTTLDEASLEAARESNDPAMIGKIYRLWIEQRQGK